MEISSSGIVRWLLATSLALAVVTPAGGQAPPTATPDSALRAALQDYKNNNIKQSLATLLAIAPAKLEIAVHELMRTELRARRFEVLEIAAIALTESSAAGMELPNGQWQTLHRLAREVGKELMTSGDTSKSLRAWCLAEDAFGEGLRDLAALEPMLAGAREIYKNDAEILLASGSLYEMRARGMTSTPVQDAISLPPQIKRTSAGFPGASGPRSVADRTGDLKRARDFYTQTVSLTPPLAEARLRLARVLHQLGDLPGATAALDALPTAGLSDEMTYLSRLFRADVEEDRGHADTARAAYLAAMEWRAQAPFVGLAALVRSGGDAAASLAVTERLFHDAPDTDPWRSYLKGQGWHFTERLDAARATIR